MEFVSYCRTLSHTVGFKHAAILPGKAGGRFVALEECELTLHRLA